MSVHENKKHDIHEELLIECEKGNRRARNKIYELYYKAMYNTCLRIVNSREDAEDIMQEAFLSAFQNLRQRREESSFGTWLKRITINKSLDFLRSRKMKFSDLDEKWESHECLEENFDFYSNPEKMQALKKEVQNLKDKYRIVFNLKTFEGYDHEEIAQILNLKPSTVRSLYTRAKQIIFEQLKTKKIL